ncbi:MAG: hypothetical protein K8I27_10905 [Planctomycetes bacterium]|nr:hypothetical protein [Planctomycetota bacterium]
MIRTLSFLIVTLLCAPAFANDIAVAAPDGKSGWFLLEDPLGPGGSGLSNFAGDPGLPAPDALRWPHTAEKPLGDSSYPLTELWKFTDGDAAPGTWQRVTRFLDHQSSSARRTLHGVFLLNGIPYVLHYDPYDPDKKDGPGHLLGGGYSQLIRVGADAADATTNQKALVAKLKTAVVLNSARNEIFDAPEPSPDGKHVALRVTKPVGGKWCWFVRVYETANWKQVAELLTGPTSRLAWVNETTLAYIAWDGDSPPTAPQAKEIMSWYVRLHDSHAPKPGTLKLATFKENALAETELLTGEFPPDHYTRTLLAEADGSNLLVARKEGDGIVIELREPKAGGKATPVAVFESFRGCAITKDGVSVAGIRTIERSKVFVRVELVDAKEAKPTERVFRQVSTDGHGGLINLGHGVTGMLEAVANPDYDHKVQQGQLLRHTLLILNWYGCDSMRNPRVIQKLSKMVRRFDEIGTVRSTLLVFDIEIAANGGKNEKKGRYVELYGSGGRKGGGRIRTEDNLGGQWIVQGIDGGGDKDTDDYYNCVGKDGAMKKKSAIDAGKAYDDLVTQLEARKLLMLNDVERDPLSGGLMFLHRAFFRDPNSGANWRTWVFAKYGRVIDTAKQATLESEIAKLRKDREADGADVPAIDKEIALRELQLRNLPRERLITHFVADLPNGSAGDWNFPHALAQVEMRFAISNQQNAAVTNLYFEPDKWVALPDVTDRKNGSTDGLDLLLPKVFRIYENEEGKPTERLKAVATDPARPVAHPQQLVRGGELRPGYNIPLAAFSKTQYTEKQR